MLSWKRLFTTWNLTFVVAMETSSWGHSLCFAQKRHFDMISGEGAPSTHLSTPFLPPIPGTAMQLRVHCRACPWDSEPWLALLNLPVMGECTPQGHTPTAGRHSHSRAMARCLQDSTGSRGASADASTVTWVSTGASLEAVSGYGNMRKWGCLG